MFWLVLFACTSQDSRPGARSPAKPTSSAAPPAPTTGALELHLKGPAVAAKPKLERPKGCIDDAPVDAAPPGPTANALVWVNRGTARPTSAKVAWSGCRPSERAVALTPLSAIEVRNADPIALEIGIAPWPGDVAPASWRKLPPGASAGVALPGEPGLYLLVDKNHDWARVLVAVGGASAKSAADGIVRFGNLPIGSVELHVAHPDLDRVVDLRPQIAVGLTTLEVDVGDAAP